MIPKEKSLPLGSIVCPYSLYEELKTKYPNREVIPSSYCRNNEYIVARRRQGLTATFLVKTDGSIWIASPDQIFMMLKTRPRNSSYYRLKKESNDNPA